MTNSGNCEEVRALPFAVGSDLERNLGPARHGERHVPGEVGDPAFLASASIQERLVPAAKGRVRRPPGTRAASRPPNVRRHEPLRQVLMVPRIAIAR